MTGHPRSVEQFPLETDPRDMQAWRTTEKKRLRALPTHAKTGTFAKDAKNYLKARAAMTGIRERARHIDLWIAEFGNRRRSSIKPWEIAAVRDRWLLEGPKLITRRWRDDGIDRHGARQVAVRTALSVSQVCKRMRAAENLWTVLDGLHAPNPVREAGEPKAVPRAARALPYPVIETILAQIQERRYDRKLTSAQTSEIRRRHAAGERSVALADAFGCSETMVRKIVRGSSTDRSTAHLTKLRLRALAYNGFSHSELAAIRGTDLHLDDTPPWVWIRGRDKGDGPRTPTAQPLTAQGAAAVRALARAGGLGTFQRSSMWKTWQRACRKIGLFGTTPYDLRHSFATDVLRKTQGNLSLTQLMMRHASQATTKHYAEAAIDPVRAAAVASLDDQAGAKLARNVVE